MDPIIKANYISPPHPVAYTGVNKLRAITRLEEKPAKQLLSEVDTYTRHREYKRPRWFNPLYIHTRRQQIQFDLIDKQTLARRNNGFKYIVVAIISFSRKAYVRVTRTRTAQEVGNAIRSILNEIDGDFEVFFSDRGEITIIFNL
jgi:hypothetical protein